MKQTDSTFLQQTANHSCNREYYLEPDASGDGIGYICGQFDDEGRNYVVTYGGRGLRPCERKWP